MPIAPVEDLINHIYAAAADPSRWSVFLNVFAQRLRLNNSILVICYPEHPQFAVRAWGGVHVTTEIVREYSEKWVHQDPWMSDKDLSKMPLGVVVPSEQLCPDERLEKTEVYRAFLEAHGYHYGGGVMLALSEYQIAVHSAARPKELGPLTLAELELWQSLVPHLLRAVALQGRLGLAESERELFQTFFESSPYAMVLSNENGAVMAANRAAEQVLKAGDGMTVVNNHLFAGPLQREFARLLKEAGFPGAAIPRPPAADIVIPRSSDSPLLAVVSPLLDTRPGYASATKPTVMVQFVDSTLAIPPEGEMLRKLFALTSAEAKVCLHLAAGLTVQNIAEFTYISQDTVRTHLKRILLKTNTRRQAELIALLQRIAFQNLQGQAPDLG